MRDYIAPQWKNILTHTGYRQFNDFWQLIVPNVDKPNTNRGGWSSVGRLAINNTQNIPQYVYLKRQCNHKAKTFLHPIKGIATFQREFNNIKRYQKLKIPTLQPIYFSIQKEKNKINAILITEALEGYISLDRLTQCWNNNATDISSKDLVICKTEVIEEIAKTISTLHNAKMQHHCLYAKHIFIKYNDNKIDVRIIDLEKSKRIPPLKRFYIKDLTSLHRHIRYWPEEDVLFFLKKYAKHCNKKFNPESLYKKIMKRQQLRHS